MRELKVLFDGQLPPSRALTFLEWLRRERPLDEPSVEYDRHLPGEAVVAVWLENDCTTCDDFAGRARAAAVNRLGIKPSEIAISVVSVPECWD